MMQELCPKHQEASTIPYPSDSKLVVQAQGGDQAAFSELVRRYHGRIFNVVYGLVGNLDDTDDLTQDAFVRAYRSLPRFQHRAQFYTWVYRIAINCFRDWCKSSQRTREVSAEWVFSEDGERFIERIRGPELADDRIQSRELQELLENALSTLPPEYRATIVLRDIEGLTYPEIAEAMGCAMGTVKSRLFRSRKHLSELWEGKYKTLWEGADAHRGE